MLSANNITLQYGKRVLFDEVNIKFNGDNCYGVIGQQPKKHLRNL